MRFGLLYHLQVPRPWAEDSEERVFNEALEQIELADRLGFDYAWATEHHFLDEYSHSTAPEVFLAAAAARTKNIRLAHGITTLPPAVNHPARVAERLATLDLISGGRVDFGSGQGSTQHELEAFGIERSTKKDQWREGIEAVTRMLSETPFTGYQGRYVNMPPRNVIPKPKQKPHPPLWVACSWPPTVESAARMGMGALSLAYVTAEEVRERVDAYYRLIASEECVPVGQAVNPNFAVVQPMLCHTDPEVALDRGLEGIHWLYYGFMHFYVSGEHAPGTHDLTAEFEEMRAEFGLTRTVPEELRVQFPAEYAERIDSLKQCVGSPEQLRQVIRAYEDAGVDQVIFQAFVGNTRHEHVCESLELFAREVMPEFAQRRPAREAAKAERLAVPIKAALSRIEPNTTDVSDYVISTDMMKYPEAAPPLRDDPPAQPTAGS